MSDDLSNAHCRKCRRPEYACQCAEPDLIESVLALRERGEVPKDHPVFDRPAGADWQSGASLRDIITTLKTGDGGRDDLQRTNRRYQLAVEDARRYFGEWDMCDPVVWAILALVHAQNDLAQAFASSAEIDPERADRAIEQATAARLEAIKALQAAAEM